MRAHPVAHRPLWQLLTLLVAMTAIGPIMLNIVVPALPNLAAQLVADPHTVQLTVSLYLAGLAAAQLPIGPLSDRFGRRPVVLAGLALTVVASFGAIAATSVTWLIAARIVQAVGASTGLAVSRAIIRDLFDRERSAAMIGLVATAMVVAPMIAPLIGGLLETAFGWRAIFLFVGIVSLVVLIWAAAILPETRRQTFGSSADAGFLADLRRLATSTTFLGYVLCAAFGSGTFFVFLGGGPHAVVTLMGRSPAEYGVWFALSSLGYMSGNFATSRLSEQHGVDAMIRWGLAFEAFGVLAAILLALFAHAWGPAGIFLPQLVISFGNGLMLPNAIAGAVSVRPQAAGTASGILGCAQMAVGAAFVQLGGQVLMGAASALPMALLMAGVTVAFALAFYVLVQRRLNPS